MADNPPPPSALAEVVRLVGPFVPGMAGALLGMAFAVNLTVRGRILALAAGVASVLWLAPAAAFLIEHLLLAGQPLPARLLPFVGFSTGLFGMALLSGSVQAVARYASDPLSLVRIEFRGVTITGGHREGEAP